jgi:hypothetical protein
LSLAESAFTSSSRVVFNKDHHHHHSHFYGSDGDTRAHLGRSRDNDVGKINALFRVHLIVILFSPIEFLGCVVIKELPAAHIILSVANDNKTGVVGKKGLYMTCHLGSWEWTCPSCARPSQHPVRGGNEDL